MQLGAIPPEPLAHRDAGEHDIGGGERARIGDVDGGRGGAQVVGHVGEQFGLAHEHGHRVAFGDVGHQRQHLAPHPIAHERGVEVRRIVERLEPLDGADGLGLGPTQRQDRMPMARSDAGEPVGTGTAQEVHEHGLRLIIGGVSQRGLGAEHLMAGEACPRLEIGPGLDRQRFGPERDTEPRRDLGHEHRLDRGLRPDAVIDVHRGDHTVGGDGEHQQRQRIGTPGHAAHEPLPRSGEGAAGEEIGMAVGESARRDGHGGARALRPRRAARA